jgi:hypothetical protein
MTAAVTPMSVTPSRHRIAVPRPVVLVADSPGVGRVDPRRQVLGVPAFPAAVMPVGAARQAGSRVVHAVLLMAVLVAVPAIAARAILLNAVIIRYATMRVGTIRHAAIPDGHPSGIGMLPLVEIEAEAREVRPPVLTAMPPLVQNAVHRHALSVSLADDPTVGRQPAAGVLLRRVATAPT